MTKRFSVAPDVQITITAVGADLHVRGWSKNEIKTGGDSVRIDVSEDGKSAVLTASGDCDVFVPEHANLQIGQVGADARIAEIVGSLDIGNIGADLRLREVGNVRINNIGADTRIRQVNGSVAIERVGADATLYEVSGDVKIGYIGADAYVREVAKNCFLEQVNGDLILQIDYQPGNEYSCSNLGDVVCRVHPDADVRFHVETSGDVQLELKEGRLESSHDPEYDIVFKEGKAHVELKSHGDVRFVEDDDSEPFDLGVEFDATLDIDLENVLEQTNRAAERARRQAERVREQLQREAERASEQMRRQAEKMAQEAQREFERQRSRMAGRPGGFNFGWNWESGRARRGTPMPPPPPMAPPMAPRPPGSEEPVSNEERLIILRMVEAKQITVDEAEKLLAALEGRG